MLGQEALAKALDNFRPVRSQAEQQEVAKFILTSLAVDGFELVVREINGGNSNG